MVLTLTIFILVYLAMAVGHLPGLHLDRTGAALVGAMLMISFGAISPAAAWAAVDYRTIGLLFGLLVVSATFMVSGFYDRVAQMIGGLDVGPKKLLAIVILITSGLAALLNKDVVAVAMTPVLCTMCIKRRLNPLPFLLAFCFAANFASAATLIGSPQSMIIAETLNLSFVGFSRAATLPALLSLPIIWVVVVLCYRGRWELSAQANSALATDTTMTVAEQVEFNLGETTKAALVTIAVIIAFIATDWPHMLISLTGASCLLISRRYSSNNMLRHVDGDVLLLLFGLFIVNAAFTATGIPENLLSELRASGIELQDPLSMLLIMSVISNIIGNNPSVMLIVPLVKGAAHPEALGAAIALGCAFSSSAVVFGSIVGIVVSEECKKRNITIGFTEFARAGVPASILALLMAAVWINYIVY